METNTVTKLVLIAKKAREGKRAKFSRLMYLLNENYLFENFKMLKRSKAAGMDGRVLESYNDEEIKQAIKGMVERLKSRKFNPQPVRRVYIKKDNGSIRPLGIPTVMDKILQLGTARILESIYESDFLASSYGYRKGKDAHAALKEINHMIMGRKVNYILEADIVSFFDNLNHRTLLKCLNQRVSDPHFKRLIWKMLKAGIMEGNTHNQTQSGTPQGGIISPVLANIYLHYCLDLFFEKRIKQKMVGYVQLLRYADDFVIGIQYQNEAGEILNILKDRLKDFNLTLSEEKTKVLEFGRFAKESRNKTAKTKPETFNFLGLTHYCSQTRDGRFSLRVKTQKQRMEKAITSVSTYLKTNRTRGLKTIWQNLKLKLTGHYNYYGLSGNYQSLKSFYGSTKASAFKWLNRRGGKQSFGWEEFEKYLKFNPLPKPKLTYAIYNTW